MPTWTQSMAVGVPMLDEQHRELFCRTDRLLAAMKEGRPATEVERLLGFLDEYCSRHFSEEEKLMRDRAYPGLAEHLAQHAQFVEKFEEIVSTFRQKGPSPSVAIGIQQLVCRWLAGHIAAVDRKLADHLAPRA